jgi:transposase
MHQRPIQHHHCPSSPAIIWVVLTNLDCYGALYPHTGTRGGTAMPRGRLLLTDAAWQERAVMLAPVQHQAGRPPRQNDRLFLEAVLSRARTGLPWRELPEEFGPWDAVDTRCWRWEKRYVWQPCWYSLQADACQGQLSWSDLTPIASRGIIWPIAGVKFPLGGV